MKPKRRKKPEKSTIKQLRKSNIIECAKELEGLLESEYGAIGRSLRDKTLDVADRLPYGIQMAILRLNYIRNQAAHEATFKPSEIELNFAIDKSDPKHNFQFIKCFEEVRHYLKTDEYLKA